MQTVDEPWREANAVSTLTANERLLVRFMNLQLFSLVYLQKFALGPISFQLSLPMLIMIGSLAWMLMRGHISFATDRIGLYLLFVGLCLFSEALAGGGGSVPSLLQLFLLYFYMTVSATLPGRTYMQLLDRFMKLMILPSCIIIFQYVFQTVTGQSNPLSMNRMLPRFILLQGYIYEGPLHFGQSFMRPNGFVFLETSFASGFTATAAIIEMTHFKRPKMVLLMLAATIMSLGGTGITMLVAAAPVLLARLKPATLVLLLVLGVSALVVAPVLGIKLPLISRMNEFGSKESSGSDRLLLPASQLVNLLTNPDYLIRGTGAGSTNTDFGSAWPVVKLMSEYGILAMIAFVCLYIRGIGGSFNLPLKVALSVAYNFTGGYLLNPILVEVLVVLCFIITPVWPRRGDRDWQRS